jgi:hypothetical protein
MYHHRHRHQGPSDSLATRSDRAAEIDDRTNRAFVAAPHNSGGGGRGYAGSNSSRVSLSGLSAVSVGSSVGTGKARLPAQGILTLHVVRGESLTHVHLSPTTGPYLAIAHGKTRHKTRVDIAGGVNPQWNERFEMYIATSDARKQSVLFTVKNKKVSSGSTSSGGGGDDDSRSSIISTITSAASGGRSSVLGVANVKLISLCAKERTLLIPLRQVGSSKPAGCIKVRVSFEVWNAGPTGAGLPVVPVGATADFGNPTTTGLSHQRLQHHAKQQLMMMPRQQQPPPRRSSAPPMMMGIDQRDDYGPLPSPPHVSTPRPSTTRGGLPPRFPSRLGKYGGYYRLEDSFAGMELIDATPANRCSAGKVPPKHRRSGGGQNPSSENRIRGGGESGGGGGGGSGHRRDPDYRLRKHRPNHNRRWDHQGEDACRDDTTARRDDVPSIVDCYDEDDDHWAIESEFTTDRIGRAVLQEDSWERAKVPRPRVYTSPSGAMVSTSKFLCF